MDRRCPIVTPTRNAVKSGGDRGKGIPRKLRCVRLKQRKRAERPISDFLQSLGVPAWQGVRPGAIG